MAFDLIPVTVDNGENTDYTAATRTTTAGRIVGCQLDIGTNTTPSPVTPANPLPTYGASAPVSALSAGNIISEGPILAATIDGVGVGGSTLVNWTSAVILSIMFFNQLTSECEISIDGGATWLTLPALASPTLEFGRDGRKIVADILARKKGATTVTGTDLMAWGKI